MERTSPHQWLLFLFLVLVVTTLQEIAEGEARDRIINITCGSQKQHNSTLFVPNFIAVMENITSPMKAFGSGWAVFGTGPDTNYGLGQCHKDLTSDDCVLYFSEIRIFLPQCYPKSGGRIYLDGCFLRYENYSFFGEYSAHYCRNRLRGRM